MSSNMSLLNVSFLIFFALSFHRAFGSSRGLHPKNDAGYEAARQSAGMCSDVVATHGYKCQEYEVKTGDGYILSVQRIPEGRNGGGGTNRPPVLLQHGILVDGVSWVIYSPQDSLALMLADNGFDVWISNVRGTQFSKRHATLDPSKPEYWNWSWDELVANDLPSFINLVYTQTGQKVHYVGHSLGTLMVLASLAEGKEINDKIRSAALLSPIAYLSHMTTQLGNLAARAFIGEITDMIGVAEFDLKGQPVTKFLKLLCADPAVDCYDMLTAVTGKNCCLNESTVEVTLKYEPQSTATKNFVHLAQTVRSGILSKYDYGNTKLNVQHYGTSKPPLYDLSKIPHDIPLFLGCGGRDALSDAKDMATLLNILRTHDQDKLQMHYIENYAHVDFVMGVNANVIVYNHIIDFFRKHH